MSFNNNITPFENCRNQYWNKMLNLYKEFKVEFNREPKYRDVYKGFNLGAWCNSQRVKFRKNELINERKKLLLDAGFSFEVKRRSKK